MPESSSVQFSRCKGCEILSPSSKMVPQHSRDLSKKKEDKRKTSDKKKINAEGSHCCLPDLSTLFAGLSVYWYVWMEEEESSFLHTFLFTLVNHVPCVLLKSSFFSTQ